MKEAIQDDFRQWYMEFKRVSGKFPDFPEEEVWKTAGFKFTTFADPANQVAAPKEEGELFKLIYF